MGGLGEEVVKLDRNVPLQREERGKCVCVGRAIAGKGMCMCGCVGVGQKKTVGGVLGPREIRKAQLYAWLCL